MTQRFCKIIIASLSIISATSGFAQQKSTSLSFVSLLTPVTIHYDAGSKARNPDEYNRVPIVLNTEFQRKLPVALPNMQPGSITNNFYVQHFGYFCRQEWKLEKVTKMPFRFRLGSLDYCNTLEQK